MRATVCDGFTGARLDEVPVSEFSWSRLRSAGDSGSSCTIPLDGSFTGAELRSLLTPWRNLIVLESDRGVEYIGYVHPFSYTVGSGQIVVPLSDWWSLAYRRGGWDHNAEHVELWSTSSSASLARHAVNAVERGSTGPSAPRMDWPVTTLSTSGSSVDRTVWGYYHQTVGEMLEELMGEGLDIYMRPRWASSGAANWVMEVGPNWGTGTLREFVVTAERSEVTDASWRGDDSQLTNNARFVGEGSEQDMLVRSNRNLSSDYPLLDRVTMAKNVSDTSQLTALANQDLVAFAEPTGQWDFSVLTSTAVDVGDTVRLWFAGDPIIPDGSVDYLVVGIKGDLGEKKTVIVQGA